MTFGELATIEATPAADAGDGKSGPKSGEPAAPCRRAESDGRTAEDRRAGGQRRPSPKRSPRRRTGVEAGRDQVAAIFASRSQRRFKVAGGVVKDQRPCHCWPWDKTRQPMGEIAPRKNRSGGRKTGRNEAGRRDHTAGRERSKRSPRTKSRRPPRRTRTRPTPLPQAMAAWWRHASDACSFREDISHSAIEELIQKQIDEMQLKDSALRVAQSRLPARQRCSLQAVDVRNDAQAARGEGAVDENSGAAGEHAGLSVVEPDRRQGGRRHASAGDLRAVGQHGDHRHLHLDSLPERDVRPGGGVGFGPRRAS